jgi:hypothetical protein
MFKTGDEIVYYSYGKYRPGTLGMQMPGGLWEVIKPGDKRNIVLVLERQLMLRDIYFSPLREALDEID